MKDEKTAVFVFDEDVIPLENSFSVSCELSQSGNKVFAVLRQFLKPGNEQVISGSVSDKSGNTTRIKVNLCGYNSHPAVLLIPGGIALLLLYDYVLTLLIGWYNRRIKHIGNDHLKLS